MKVLVTGASGATGSHLVSHLRGAPGIQIYTTDLRVDAGTDCCSFNLIDYDQVLTLFQTTMPDQVYHLAGAFSNDYDTDYKANVLSTKNLFDACLALGLKCRILLVGSSAEYGIVDEHHNPVREDHPLKPVSTYGVTKAYQTVLMGYYRSIRDCDVVMARTFNLLGKGLSNKLFIGRLFEQIELYKTGAISTITLGNLQNKRDYLDIDEAVKAYQLIMNHGSAGEVYNVGSGKSEFMYELLNNILTANNLDMKSITTNNFVSDNKLDIKDIYADITKLNQLKQAVHK